MAVFKAFKPEAMNKIAKAMGYTGDMGQFQSYIEQDPMRQQQMQRYTNAAMQMARGEDAADADMMVDERLNPIPVLQDWRTWLQLCAARKICEGSCRTTCCTDRST